MEIIYLLIPLSLVLIGVIVWAFFWAVRSGQFDDLEGPAHRILMDDDSIEAGRGTQANEEHSRRQDR
jgi:cbb3-type cytochrome oxidase maturation protein